MTEEKFIKILTDDGVDYELAQFVWDSPARPALSEERAYSEETLLRLALALRLRQLLCKLLFGLTPHEMVVQMKELQDKQQSEPLDS